MKLTVLADNNTFIDQYYYGEPAVCYDIWDDSEHILWDAGYSDIFIKNADLLQIDLQSVDTIAISHGHNDHTRGLSYLIRHFETSSMKLISHPDTFLEKWDGNELIGSVLTEEEIRTHFSLSYSEKPVKISKNIWFLGEIPELFLQERRRPIGKKCIGNTLQPDDLVDDTALVYQGEEGLLIITGCSHSGICNIIEYAKQVCKDTRIWGIIGGFHLFDADEQLEQTIQYLERQQVKQLYPCHCVSLQAKAKMLETLPVQEVGVGMVLNWK